MQKLKNIPSKNSLLQNYKNHGFCVIDDAAPILLADKLRDAWSSADYEYIVQKRKKHYQHLFNIGGDDQPDFDEEYIARFHQTTSVLKNPLVDDLLKIHIMQHIGSLNLIRPNEHFKLLAYKMDANDVFRTHVDDYVGNVGFIYYLCKRWKWDWGGILGLSVNDSIISTLPKFNRLVIINHGQRLPHFVSMVTDYALESRFMLVGITQNELAS